MCFSIHSSWIKFISARYAYRNIFSKVIQKREASSYSFNLFCIYVLLLTLGVARVVVVVSPEVATRRKYRLNGNDHVNNLTLECIMCVHRYSVALV